MDVIENSPISLTPWQWRSPLFGLYSTWETVGSQLFIAALVVFLWNLGNKVMKKPICETGEGKSVRREELVRERV